VLNKIRQSVKKSKFILKHKSKAVNIYHCCVQKTASQWIQALLSDTRIHKFSGLTPHHYGKTFYGDFDIVQNKPTKFTDSLPQNTIVSPLYIDFKNFIAIPKPEDYKAFFITRDPRDIMISWYFSVKYSHKVVGRIAEHRQVLTTIPTKDGLTYTIDYLQEYGLFDALRSWTGAPIQDSNIVVVRFEDLTSSDNLQVFKGLFLHCDIQIPETELLSILQEYSFNKLSGGRKRGDENKSDHYRKGVPGDWKNYFDDAVVAKFKETTGNLVVQLGFEQNENWKN